MRGILQRRSDGSKAIELRGFVGTAPWEHPTFVKTRLKQAKTLIPQLAKRVYLHKWDAPLLHQVIGQVKDPRLASNNTRYSLKDAVLGAFSVFFMQCESFLEHQRQMQSRQGQDNAQTLFGLVQVPTMLQIRNILDKVMAQELFAVEFYQKIRQQRGTRKGFFQDILSLTKYLLFESWQHLIDFMLSDSTTTVATNSS